MPFLLQSLSELTSETHQDFFSMLFLTGARKTNVRMMSWTEINWDQSEWRIPLTKNGEPVIVPLIPRAMEILRRRFVNTRSKWVFPHEHEKEKCMVYPKETWRDTLVRATLYRWREHETSSFWMQQVESDLKGKLPDKERLKIIIERAKNKT